MQGRRAKKLCLSHENARGAGVQDCRGGCCHSPGRAATGVLHPDRSSDMSAVPSVWRTEVDTQEHVAKSYWSPLRYQRKLRGWSQQDLVNELCKLCYKDERIPGLNVRTIGRWERGESKPSPYYCKRLCQLFNMTTEELGVL